MFLDSKLCPQSNLRENPLRRAFNLLLVAILVQKLILIFVKGHFRRDVYFTSSFSSLPTTLALMFFVTFLFFKPAMMSLKNPSRSSRTPSKNLEESLTKMERATQNDEKETMERAICTEQDTSEAEHLNKDVILVVDNRVWKAPPSRVYFLDNLKSFLTFMVITFHCACSFGACKFSSFLQVAEYTSYLSSARSILQEVFLLNFVDLSQAYQMPLFFFVSAYFTPTSYDRKGHNGFIVDKAKRLFVPSAVVCLLLTPLGNYVYMSVAHLPRIYITHAAHCWFTMWLLIFNHQYGECRLAAEKVSNTKSAVVMLEPKLAFPSTRTRMVWALGVCGIGSLVVILIFGEFEVAFFGMPIGMGSLPNDIFMFICGLIARRNHWISADVSIREKLDIPVWMLRSIVFVEFLSIVILRAMKGVFVYPALVLSGLFCIDFCVALLEFFQTNFNTETPRSKTMAQAAYTAYLIHGLLVNCLSAVFVIGYNMLQGDVIKFNGIPSSCSKLNGPDDGGVHIMLGFLGLCVAVNLVTWPLASFLAHAPGFRSFLL